MKIVRKASVMPITGMYCLAFFLICNPQMTSAAIEAAKTIYVDLSECIEANYSELSLTLQIVGEGGRNVGLNHLENGVFVSETPIETALFSKEEKTYHILWRAGETNYTVTFTGVMPFYEETYNYICLSNYEDGNREPLKGYGFYGARKKNPGATCLTQRVWLYDADTEFVGDYAVGYVKEGHLQLVSMENTINSYDRLIYHFVDVPYELSEVFFMKLRGFCIDFWVKTPLIYGGCFNLRGPTFTTAIVDGADADLLGAVVEAYLTYGSSPSNGSVGSTISTVFQTFFKNKSAFNEDLRETNILDYGDGSYKEGRYDPNVPKTAYYSVNEKWNTLCSQAGIDPRTGETRGWNLDLSFSGDVKKSVIIAGGALFVVIIGGLAYLIWKWRKGSLQ